MAKQNQMTPEQAAQAAAQANFFARTAILRNSVPMLQQIDSKTVVPANNPTITMTPRNVGLITGFWIQVTATVNNAGANTVVPTDFGGMNILSNIQFTDYQNNLRVNCSGAYLNFQNSAKWSGQFGAALLTTAQDGDAGIAGQYGNNWTVNSQTASVATTANGTITWWYYIPCALNKYTDLSGAVYANVINATALLSFTFNPTPVVASTADTTSAVYVGTAATGSITSATVTMYQEYYDQIPQTAQGPLLPIQDISTTYNLQETAFSGMTPAQDFPFQFTNMRTFLRTHVMYYNGTARAAGTDINYLMLQSANFTQILKVSPSLSALLTRVTLRTDYPKGVYMLDSTQKPINTVFYGNMQLVINPITAGATAYARVGWEFLALSNTLPVASSLPATA